MAQETVLLVIGNWGCGKSATANTLLGHNAFPKNNNTTQAVTETDVKKSLDKTLSIVDGLCLWGKDPKNLQEDTFNDAQKAVSICGSGFNAILIVMRYGESYSDEDARVVAVAKKVFGPKIFQNFGICVFTRGDDFKYAVEEGEEPCTTFSDWYKSRSGNLKQLLGECGQRCVLFDNKEKDPKEKNALLKLVNQLSKNGTKRYTLNDFQKYHGRDFSTSVSKTMIEKTFRDELENIKKKFNDKAKRADLPKMLSDLRDLSQKISQSHIDQKIIESLISIAQTLTANIKAEWDRCSANGDKKIPTISPGYSDRSHLDKDRTLPGISDRSLVDKDRPQPGISGRPPLDRPMPVISDRSTLDKNRPLPSISSRSPLDKDMPSFYIRPIPEKDSDLRRFSTNDISQKSYDGGTDTAVQAEKLINDFISNTSFTKGGADIEKRYANMKSQVLELLQSSPYLDTFKSRLAKIENEIRNQLGSEGSSIEKEIADAMEIPDERTDTLPENVKASDDLKLLLLGRSGNGKSSTGISLLGRPAFRISSSVAASKSVIALESQMFEKFTLSVVDGPSLDDTVLDTNTGLDEMLKSMKEALQLCDYSFSGLLVILKFGQRFTKQEKNAVGLIKSILGKDVLKKYGICVMTHGDNYDSEMEEEKIDFLEWCKMQTGEIAELFEECSYRCVLIDNRTRDEQTQIKQRIKVLDLIKRTENYSEEEFVDAEKDFEELSIQCAIPQLEQANSLIMSKIRDKLQQLEQKFPKGEGEYKAELESMQQALRQYIHNIESLGPNKKIEYLLQLVRTLQMQINSKLRLCHQTEELRQLEKEKEKIQENVSNRVKPMATSQDERPTNHFYSRDQSSFGAPRPLSTAANTSMSRNYDMSQHAIDLNAFLEESQIRWVQANSDEHYSLQRKEVLISKIDAILKEADRRGERNEASDNACAWLVDMREKIANEIEKDMLELARQGNYQQSHLKYTEKTVYPHQNSTRQTHPSLYPSWTNATTLPTAQHQQGEQWNAYKHPNSGSSKKVGKKKRWSKIKSFLTSIFKAVRDVEFEFLEMHYRKTV